MKLRYLGTGTVLVEGSGEVSHGETLDVPDRLAQAFLVERPEQWEEAGAASAAAPAEGASDQPRARRGR